MAQKVTDYYKKIRGRLQKGSFSHSVMLVIGGSMLGQMMSVLLSPLLTRVYSPDEFGLLGSFSSVAVIISVIACLRYEMALPITKDDSEEVNLFAVCLVALAATFLVGMAAVFLIPRENLGKLSDFLWMLPFAALCIGAYNLMVSYATRRGAFATISKTKIYQGISAPTSQLAFGAMGLGVLGLIVGFIIGQSMGVAALCKKLIFHGNSDLKLISFAKMRAIAKRFIRFPLISSWSGLVNMAGSGAFLLLVLPIFYSSTITGFYFLIERIVARPLLIISSSLLQVYIGDISKAKTDASANIYRRFLQVALFQLVIVSGWLIVVNIVAYFGFGIIFGKVWQEAVPYLQVLSISYLPQMVVHSLTHTLQVLEKQGRSAIWEIGRLLAISAAFIGGYAAGLPAIEALLLYAIAQGLSQIVLFCLMYQAVREQAQNGDNVSTT